MNTPKTERPDTTGMVGDYLWFAPPSRSFFQRANGVRIGAEQAPRVIVRESPDRKQQSFAHSKPSELLMHHQLGDPGDSSVPAELLLDRDRISK